MQSKYQLQTLATLCMAMALSACGSDDDRTDSNTPSARAVELSILHINDHHSHLDEEAWTFAFDRGQGEEEFNATRGGFPRVASLINQLAEQKPNVLKLHSGDAITGDLYFNLTDGEADAKAMNSVCFDSFVLGNHEFDAKDAGLKKFIDYLDQSTCNQPVQVLSANVQFGQSSELRNDPRVQPYRVFERGGESFGLIGLTIAGKTKNSSQPNADTLFADEVTTAQRYIDQLKQQGINRIILQTHIGYEFDQSLAAQLTDVDVIIGGDSHTLLGPTSLNQVGLSPSGAYPTQVRNKDGDLVCIAQAWQYSYVVGELNVSFDPNGKVSACTGTPHVLLGSEIKKGDTPLNDNERTQLLAQFQAAQIPLRVVEPDPATQAILQPYQAEKQAFANVKIGQAETNLCLRRVPGRVIDPNRSTIASCNIDPQVIQQGGDIQQLVAEAFYQQGKAYFNADFSIQNAGGVRIDIPQNSDVTVATIYTVLPFKNTLVRVDMTGAEVIATLEDAISNVVDQRNTGSYPYAGGLRWHVDSTQAKGQRLSGVEVRTANGSYVPLEQDKTYRVITMDFLADGQDGYSTLKTITGDRRIDVGLDYAEAFLTYAQSLEKNAQNLSKMTKLASQDYSTQSFKE